MAFRPHTVKLNKGQATFAYMPQEEAENYEKVLLNYEKSKEGNSDTTGFHSAVGCHLNSSTKKYELVVIKYNPLTKETVIQSIEEVATMKKYADSKLKNKLAELKLV